MNNCIFIGNLTSDPDYRESQNGNAICTLRVADNRRYTGKDGQVHEETLFMDVKAFKNNATKCRQFFSKGSKIAVVGRLALQTWQTKDGQKREKIVLNADTVEFLSIPEERAPRHERPAPLRTSASHGGGVSDDFDPRLNNNSENNGQDDLEDTPF